MALIAMSGEMRNVGADSISVKPNDAGDPVSFWIGEETAFMPSREAVARVLVVGLDGRARATVSSGEWIGLSTSSRPPA